MALGTIAFVTVVAFLPLIRNDFVNWDDPAVIVNNPALSDPHIVAWAFKTTLIGHYQPLAWVAWAMMKRLFGVNAMAFHAVSLAGHVLNAMLVYALGWRLTGFAMSDSRTRMVAGLTAALTYAVHPIRVEAVAWASAFPYVLSLVPLLAAQLWYLRYCATADRSRAIGWLALAIASYAMSLLVRPTAIAFPLVLLVLDAYPLRRALDRRVLLEKVPFLVVALAAAVGESRAREIASLQDVGIGARLTMAVASPFVYLGRTALPTRLSPLDPLPISPAVDWVRLSLGVAGLAAISYVTWRTRRRWPALAVAWVIYVLLLAPVVGLTPSGLQATADRYMYVPGVGVSLLIGIAAARAWPRDRGSTIGVPLLLAVSLALGALTWRQTRWWRDSITLWTRAADEHPRNDVATYNLAIALSDAGRDDEAILQYERTLRLVPDQSLARRNLNTLQASRAEREGDRLADSGHLLEADREYTRALDLDGGRLHARAARGIVRMRLNRGSEALADLQAAYDANVRDAPVLNALAFGLTEAGRFDTAVAVLERGVELYPADVDLAHNLARLLATVPDSRLRDGARAVQLALAVRNRLSDDDPRVLDTLAAAYAAAGRVDLARATAERASARARELGDQALATEIAARARSYRRP